MTHDIDSLARRVDAIERAVGTASAGGSPEDPADAAPTATDLEARIEAVEDRLEAVESRLDDLDGAVQAVRGYAGAVRAVNQSVERRADLALAKAERGEATRGDGAATPAGADVGEGSGLVVERVADPESSEANADDPESPAANAATGDGPPPTDGAPDGTSPAATGRDDAGRWPTADADVDSGTGEGRPGQRSGEDRTEGESSLAERLRDVL